MSKYIIKNCPCYSSKYEYCLGRATKYCKDAIYCPIKQIVELCEQYKKDFNTTNGVWLLANNITYLLDIQEVLE